MRGSRTCDHSEEISGVVYRTMRYKWTIFISFKVLAFIIRILDTTEVSDCLTSGQDLITITPNAQNLPPSSASVCPFAGPCCAWAAVG